MNSFFIKDLSIQNTQTNNTKLTDPPGIMAETVPTTISFEVNQITEGQYEVKQLKNEKPADLNSGNRQEFNFDVAVFSVRAFPRFCRDHNVYAYHISSYRFMATSTSRTRKLQFGHPLLGFRSAMATKLGSRVDCRFN
ncbi:MAG: hypothetical protein CL912_27240 [Deltaproteobacteria bacterium]|nr:hypothetical protein [Deltaproteobacteria bacterium]